ncbi:uncharacterized protein VP01_3230g8 [Puccinia sorghi]|uniref:Reverse transcriptase Ty1/copia-type domain-containing protein n=1 Tax=Puccinia sorghi TaxID=27349 RepID=A0A0L6UYA0_9BASI|nr:uncharacterized protein VP01_3230g8 [Puccinia sorghi]
MFLRTTRSSSPPLLHPAKIPNHNFDEAIKDSNDALVRRSLDKLLNPEDLSPTVFNTALVLESAEPMNTLDSQDPDSSGFTVVARNQLMPQNHARAVALWHFEHFPAGRKETDTHWLFEIKRNQDGSIKKYKARYIVQGFSQIFGQDYHDTWAPMATFALLPMLFTVATLNGWMVETFNITAAYLHGEIRIFG